MNLIKKKKFLDLKKLLMKNLWMILGLREFVRHNFDINLIIIYKGELKKIIFPKYIEILIADGL